MLQKAKRKWIWREGSRVKGSLDRRNSVCKMLALGDARYPRELEEVQNAGGGQGIAWKEGRDHNVKGYKPTKEPVATRGHRETTGSFHQRNDFVRPTLGRFFWLQGRRVDLGRA